MRNNLNLGSDSNIFFILALKKYWRIIFWRDSLLRRMMIVSLMPLTPLKSHLKKEIHKIISNLDFLICFGLRSSIPSTTASKCFFFGKALKVKLCQAIDWKWWVLTCLMSWNISRISPATRMSLTWSKMKTMPR